MKGTDRMSAKEWQESFYRVPGNKFSAAAVVEDGMRFDSKLEVRRYLYWRNLWHAHAIAWFTRQVPFYLPGGIIWRADFVVCHLHDSIARERFGDAVTVEDCKGVMTRVSINKIKQVEAIYGFKVQIIKKGKWT
jgi:Protein of unknown function (DUF1064)